MVDWIGKKLGTYEITGLIGRGGMSTVYRAQQTSVQREVAIKVLDRAEAEQQDPTFVARFEREVQIIASLEHIHILPIYDYGQSEGYSYLVMRYIDGGRSSSTRWIA
jgi:serine/threonine protein kinase